VYEQVQSETRLTALRCLAAPEGKLGPTSKRESNYMAGSRPYLLLVHMYYVEQWKTCELTSIYPFQNFQPPSRQKHFCPFFTLPVYWRPGYTFNAPKADELEAMVFEVKMPIAPSVA